MNYRIKFILILMVCMISGAMFSQQYNFKNDYKYRAILDEYNYLGKNWCVADNYQLPAQLLRYRTTDTALLLGKKNSDAPNIKSLAPLEVLAFDSDQTFVFYWYKSPFEVGDISGKWIIDNSELILSFAGNYAKPYMKNVQFRYKIAGTDDEGTELVFKGTKYPESTGVLHTSDNIMSDFEKIISAIDQQNVTDKFPEIIRAKEAELRSSLQLTEK